MNYTLKLITLGFVSSIMLVAPASAAKPVSGGGGGASASIATGNDVSWPQCSKHLSLPSGQTFGIVGVNGGLANTTNPCFMQELAWANRSSGATAQPKASLYVNTANPGGVTPMVADWPQDNTDVTTGTVDQDPYGSCYGGNDAACAWQYGYNMANLDVAARGVVNAASYAWYLDVETDNSWTANTAYNTADLEGMVAYLKGAGIAAVGVYSTAYQWGQIVGTVSPSSSLYGLPSWLAGASSATNAQLQCKNPGLTATSQVVLTQYVFRQIDYDVSCL